MDWILEVEPSSKVVINLLLPSSQVTYRGASCALGGAGRDEGGSKAFMAA